MASGGTGVVWLMMMMMMVILDEVFGGDEVESDGVVEW